MIARRRTRPLAAATLSGVVAAVVGLAGCALDFDTFEPTPVLSLGADASAPDTAASDALAPRDGSASGDATRDAPATADPQTDGACAPSAACLSTAASCAGACVTQKDACRAACNNNPCRNRCDDTEVTCRGACATTCTACTADAGCPAATACAPAPP